MKKLLLWPFWGFALGVCGQALPGQEAEKTLPFYVHESKRLPDFEREEKKEGVFVTGLPRFEFDPIRGFGVGGNLNLFFNQTKADPFFDYTAYRHRLNAEFFIFQNGRIRYALNYDAPYIFQSPWRVRLDAVHWEDPGAQYWGIGRGSLDPLVFRDKHTNELRRFRKVRAYEENLALAEIGANGQYVHDAHFHEMTQREQLYNILAERVLGGGRWRIMFGYEALFTSFSSYQGDLMTGVRTVDGQTVSAISNPTLVDLQRSDGTWARFNLSGFSDGAGYYFTSMLAAALIYDTRDFEPDPSRGVFLQYSHEYSAPWLGSQFNFHKYMLQGQYIQTLHRWHNGKRRITFAGLAAMGHIFGPNINFIEMWDLSSQAEAGGILVLGGARSVRGFREARFLAPTVGLVNLELRSKFGDLRLLKQHLSFGLNAFYDMGSVWDRPAHIHLRRWVGAPGSGLRLFWNQSTVIRLDAAVSREGEQFFFGFGHIF